MINLVRKIVAGPKNRMVDQQFDLDLTYITHNIIAMAFPASGLQKAYRNSIHDVAKFLSLKHGEQHYLIINASNRKYDYEPFNNQVLEFFWTDHQAPPITTMFELCEKVNIFLEKNQKNVVAVHCNHGKGRTGTAIISYLLYSKQFTDVKAALKYYNLKRFSGSKYAVDQPCQLRYLNYFKAFMQLPIQHIQLPLKAFKLSKVTQKGMKQKQLYIRISETRTEHIIYPEVYLSEEKIKFVRPLMGDIFIELLEHGWSGSKQMIRINFHMFFLSKNIQTNTYQVCFVGNQIKMKHTLEDFELVLEFQEFCHCHDLKEPKIDCMCHTKRQREQSYWNNMINIIKKNRQKTTKIVQETKSPNLVQSQQITNLEPEECEQFQES